MSTVDQRYLHLTGWIRHQRWVEMGQDKFSSSFIRVLDPGGLVWEGETSYPTLEEALAAPERGVHAWIRQVSLMIAGLPLI